MNAYKSFVSEHTVEYVLVPRLIKILRQRYSDVVPIFPWIGREGNSLSKELHRGNLLKMIGLFPRRPKYSKEDDTKIYIKINIELIDYFNEAIMFNVPLIAGCPLINNLWDLGYENPCLWIKLNKEATETYYLETSKDIENHKIDKNSFFESDSSMHNFIHQKCDSIHFEQALELFKNLKQLRIRGNSPFFGTVYKPIYFLLKETIDY